MFGTCGSSTFRKDLFIPAYEKEGISYFNPMVDDWDPSLAEIEAEHLNTDQIVLFPILAESPGLGSLSEIGFSIAQAMKYDDRRDFVILIDKDVSEDLKNADPIRAKDSITMRALTRAHLQKTAMPNVYMVDTLEEMLAISMALHAALEIVLPYREKYNLKNK